MNENAKKNTIDDCALINLPRIHHKSGNITPVRGNIELPFPVNRIFYLYDIPGGGNHVERMLIKFAINFWWRPVGVLIFLLMMANIKKYLPSIGHISVFIYLHISGQKSLISHLEVFAWY